VLVVVITMIAMSCTKPEKLSCISYSWTDDRMIEVEVCQSGILFHNGADVGMLCRNSAGNLSKDIDVVSGDVLSFHYVDYPSGDYSLRVDIKVVR